MDRATYISGVIPLPEIVKELGRAKFHWNVVLRDREGNLWIVRDVFYDKAMNGYGYRIQCQDTKFKQCSEGWLGDNMISEISP